MHHEPIQEFKRYLGNIGIPYKVIDKYVSYHYGYKKNNDGTYTFVYNGYSHVTYKESQFKLNCYVNDNSLCDKINIFVICSEKNNLLYASSF